MRDLALGRRFGCRRATGAGTWLARGISLEKSDPEAAMVAYRRALAGRPDLSDAHNNLGRLLHERGDLGAAEACYRRALASEPSALHWFNLGVVLEDGCRSEDAMVAYRQALACDEAFVEAHLNLARLLDRRGRVSDAPGDVQEAVRHLVKARQLRRSLG